MNRQRARLRLQEKLDWHFNGEMSIISIAKRKAGQERRRRERISRERHEAKRAFKKRFGFEKKKPDKSESTNTPESDTDVT